MTEMAWAVPCKMTQNNLDNLISKAQQERHKKIGKNLTFEAAFTNCQLDINCRVVSKMYKVSTESSDLIKECTRC